MCIGLLSFCYQKAGHDCGKQQRPRTRGRQYKKVWLQKILPTVATAQQDEQPVTECEQPLSERHPLPTGSEHLQNEKAPDLWTTIVQRSSSRAPQQSSLKTATALPVGNSYEQVLSDDFLRMVSFTKGLWV